MEVNKLMSDSLNDRITITRINDYYNNFFEITFYIGPFNSSLRNDEINYKIDLNREGRKNIIDYLYSKNRDCSFTLQELDDYLRSIIIMNKMKEA